MAILPTAGAEGLAVQERAFLALLVLAAVILIAFAITGAIGPNGVGPTYEIVPDPAGLLPF